MSLFFSASEKRLRCVPRVLVFVAAIALLSFMFNRIHALYGLVQAVSINLVMLVIVYLANKFVDRRRIISLGFCPLSCRFWTDSILGFIVGAAYVCIILAASNSLGNIGALQYQYIYVLFALLNVFCVEIILRGYFLQNFIEGFSKSSEPRVAVATYASIFLVALFETAYLLFFYFRTYFPSSWYLGASSCFLTQILMSIIFLERGTIGFTFAVRGTITAATSIFYYTEVIYLHTAVSTGLLLVCVAGCAVRCYRNNGVLIHDNFTCNGYIGDATQMATLQDDVEMAGVIQ